MDGAYGRRAFHHALPRSKHGKQRGDPHKARRAMIEVKGRLDPLCGGSEFRAVKHYHPRHVNKRVPIGAPGEKSALRARPSPRRASLLSCWEKKHKEKRTRTKP